MKKLYLMMPLVGLLMSQQSVLADEKDTPIDTLKTYNIDEVVVTSSSVKETNKLRTLPGSVSIITPLQINSRQITSIKDISSFVPNLYMPNYGAKLTSAIYIRGIGARSSGQSIGLYVDNMPYMDKSTFDFELLDIQHIEVLRGSQGTLYGRNSMGGIINIQTLSPLNYQGTKMSLSYGNYGQLDVKASHYMKLNNSLGISVGAYYNRNDGFFENAYTGEKADNEESVGGDVKLHWQINPSFKAAYTISAEYSDQGAFPYRLYDETTGNVAQVSINDPSSYTRKLINNNLSLAYETEKILFTSTTGYQYLNDDMKMDQDFTSASVFTLNQKQKQHAFSEELSMKSRTLNNYQWSFGAFGFYENLNINSPVEFKGDGVAIFQKVFDNLKNVYPKMPTLTVTDETLSIPATFKMPSYGVALYHQSTYNNLFIDGLSLTAGVRLDYEKQKLDYDSEAKMHLSILMPPMVPTLTDISSMYPSSVIDESLSQDFWQLLPKVSLKYECTSRTFTYASVSKGYKAGGYNIQMSSNIMENQMQYDIMNAFKTMMSGVEITEPQAVKDVISYKPETSWNYEIGTRSELVKDRLQAELTLFYMDIKDLQITKFVDNGNGRVLTNAGKAESYGVEASLKAVISKSLTADVNYGYTHATFRDYNNGKVDYKGNFIPYTPRHTLSVGLQYCKQLQGSWLNQVFASAQCNGAGSIFWTEANDISQKFYATVNMTVGVRKGIASFSLWSKNLTNTDYSAFYFESFGNSFVQRGRPFQFGAKLDFAF